MASGRDGGARRDDARSIFLAGVQAANPTEAVRSHVELDPQEGAIRVVAVGKAAVAMVVMTAERGALMAMGGIILPR